MPGPIPSKTLSYSGGGNSVTIDYGDTIFLFNSLLGWDYLTGSSASVVLSDDQTTVFGDANAIYFYAGVNSAVFINGDGNVVYGSNGAIGFDVGSENNNVVGSNDSITLANGDIVGVTGDNNEIHADASTIFINPGSSHDTVNGTGNNIYVAAGAVVGITGSNDNVEANLGASLWLNAGSQGSTITGAYDNIYSAAGNSFGVTGDGHTVYAGGDTIVFNQGNNSLLVGWDNQVALAAGIVVQFQGSANTISAANDTLEFLADSLGNVVNGDGNVMLLASGDTVSVTGNNNSVSGSSITASFASSARGDTVFGDGNTLNVAAGAMVGVAGKSDSIYADSSTVLINPYCSGNTILGGGNAVYAGAAGDVHVRSGPAGPENTNTFYGDGLLLYLDGGNDWETAAFSNGRIVCSGVNETLTVLGDDNLIAALPSASGETISIGAHQTGETIALSGATVIMKDFSSAKVSAGNTVLIGYEVSLTLIGDSQVEGHSDRVGLGMDQIYFSPNSNCNIINVPFCNFYAHDSTLTITGGGGDALMGAGNVIHFDTSGSLDINGVNNTIFAGSASVYFRNGDTNNSVIGTGTDIYVAAGNTISISGSDDMVFGDYPYYTSRSIYNIDGTGITIDSPSCTINLGSNDQVTVQSSNSIVNVNGTGCDIDATHSSDHTFNYAAHFGQQSLHGFNGGDVMSLSASEFANAAAILRAAHSSGADVVIGGPGGEQLTLVGVSLGDLSASQFAVF